MLFQLLLQSRCWIVICALLEFTWLKNVCAWMEYNQCCSQHWNTPHLRLQCPSCSGCSTEEAVPQFLTGEIDFFSSRAVCGGKFADCGLPRETVFQVFSQHHQQNSMKNLLQKVESRIFNEKKKKLFLQGKKNIPNYPGVDASRAKGKCVTQTLIGRLDSTWKYHHTVKQTCHTWFVLRV